MTITKRKKSQFDIFRRADIGTMLAIAGIILVAVNVLQGDLFFALIAVYVALFLSRRPNDEFAFSCWQAGCSATFRALLVALIIVPFLGGMTDEFTNAHFGTPPPSSAAATSLYIAQIEMVIALAPSAALLAFFFGFQRKRLKGV